jgi:hypothetical protein
MAVLLLRPSYAFRFFQWISEKSRLDKVIERECRIQLSISVVGVIDCGTISKMAAISAFTAQYNSVEGCFR